MKRSKGQDEGRPPQFGTRKIQTTVRIPEHVLAILKDRYGVLQRAIDAMVIVPVMREIAKARESAEQGDAGLFDALQNIMERKHAPQTARERALEKMFVAEEKAKLEAELAERAAEDDEPGTSHDT